MNSIFAVRGILSPNQKEDDRSETQAFSWEQCISKIHYWQASSDQSSYERAARGNGFQLSVSNTQRNIKQIQLKYHVNLRKSYLLTLH